MKNIFQLGVYGNFWVALCAVSQGALTYTLLGVDYSWPLLLVLFLATFFVYNIGILLDYKLLISHTNTLVSIRTQVIRDNAKSLIWLIVSAAVLIIPVAYLTLKPLSILVFIGAGVISIAYFLPVLPSKKGLRQIPGLKTLIIGLIWTMSTVLIPIIESHSDISNLVVVRLSLERFLLVLVLALVADARDEVEDKENRLATLVTYLGVNNVKYMCMVLLFLKFILHVQDAFALHSMLLIPSLLFYVLSTAIVWYAFYNRNSMFHLFIVDGLTVAQFVMVEVALFFL